MWLYFIQWFEKLQLPCTFKKYMGICCPGCGFQSSFIELLRGNILESIKIYPALLPILITILSFFVQLKLNTKFGALIVKSFFYLSLALILINFILNLASNKSSCIISL